MSCLTRFISTLLAIVAISSIANQASAQPSWTFNYQGVLKQDGAVPTFSGNQAVMYFLIYDTADPGAGTLLATSGVQLVPYDPVTGAFDFDVTIFARAETNHPTITYYDVFNGDPRWLQINVVNEPLLPRRPFHAAPIAEEVFDSEQPWMRSENGDVSLNGDGRVLVTNNPAGAGLRVEDTVEIVAPTAAVALSVSGWTRVSVLEITGGADIAEPFDIDGSPEPGMVVRIDPNRTGQLCIADMPYDSRVAGIVSGAGGVSVGMTLKHSGTVADGDHPVALTGRVWCFVDADANGPVRAGDLLTTSSTPGHAMRASDPDRAPGAVIGKAMSSLDSGRGLVLVLVNLQ